MSTTPTVLKSWQCPPADARESYRVAWLNEAAQEGANWNKNQRGSDDWMKGIAVVSGQIPKDKILQYRSQLTGNRLKTNMRVTIEGLSAIRPWGGFRSFDAYQKNALFMNETTRALYLNGFWDQDIKSCLQWASVTGSGYARPVYRRNMGGRGKGNIEIDSFGQPSVLPVQVPANGDIQQAYCTTLLDEKPIWMAHGMFPDHQDKLRPTSSKYWYASEIRGAATANNQRRPWWNPFRRQQVTGNELSDCLIPIRYTTINDLSLNTLGKTYPMGEPGSPWAYDVYAIGQQIPDGVNEDGSPRFRVADMNDARMYPFRRLIISSETCIMYDGPAFNWHGELDLIPFCLDKWPWEPTGFSLFHDGYSTQEALDAIDRGIMDKINADMDRPLAYDINAVAKREANIVDLMQPRQRIGFDGSAVERPFTQIAPDDVYHVSAESLAFRKELQADMDYTLQTRDIVELSKARALGKGIDQLEALLAANGPLVKGMSRGMEKSVCSLANQIKYLVCQYMDTSRLIPYINAAGLESVFDYDPSTLIPSHLPGEPVDKLSPDGKSKILVGSPTQRVQRARWFAESMVFTLTPHSIHEIHQMSYRLMLLQMKQRGMHIAECDILEANDVPDVERATGSTTQERFWNEKKREIEWMAKMQVAVTGSGVDVQAALSGQRNVGRPPTAQAAPQLDQKGDGRPVVSESDT
jgi:hypothetical protein